MDRDKCLECRICYLICPQTSELEDELKEKFEWHPPIGLYQDIFSAKATSADILKVSTAGGVVTAHGNQGVKGLKYMKKSLIKELMEISEKRS